MLNQQIPSFTCQCRTPKTHSLLCDGGTKHGKYRLIFCDKCYNNEEKHFVISEEIVN